MNAGGAPTRSCADVSDERSGRSCAADVEEGHPRVDIVHNNAGRLRGGSVTELSGRVGPDFAVNVRSMFLVCRALIPLMRPAAGRSSTPRRAPGSWASGTPAYNASKGAMIQLTRQLAADYSTRGDPRQLRLPGLGADRLQRPGALGHERRRGAGDGRLHGADRPAGPPEEIAAAVAFLASDEASYMAGHALVVDGGLTAVR